MRTISGSGRSTREATHEGSRCCWVENFGENISAAPFSHGSTSIVYAPGNNSGDLTSFGAMGGVNMRRKLESLFKAFTVKAMNDTGTAAELWESLQQGWKKRKVDRRSEGGEDEGLYREEEVKDECANQEAAIKRSDKVWYKEKRKQSFASPKGGWLESWTS
jgi:hypothetical protein